VYNDSQSKENLMAEGVISTSNLEDEKQRTEEAELKGDPNGTFSVTWRFEKKVVEAAAEEPTEERELLGNFTFTVVAALGLRPRAGGAFREAATTITYGKQSFTSSTHMACLDPQWDYSVIFKVYDQNDICVVRVVDMDGAMRTHLGSAKVSTKDIMAANERKEVRLTMREEIGDNPSENIVGGELVVNYRYRVAASRRKMPEITVDFRDVPDGFPPGPPAEWKSLPKPPPDMPREEIEKSIKTNQKKKYLRETWENQLALYQKKKREGDQEGMARVMQSVMEEFESPSNLALLGYTPANNEDDNPLLFPSRPRQVPANFPGNPATDPEGLAAWTRDKLIMDAWDNNWLAYQHFQKSGDKDGMIITVKKIKDIFNQQGVDEIRRISRVRAWSP